MAVTFSGTVTGATGGVQQSYALELTAALEGQFADIRDQLTTPEELEEILSNHPSTEIPMVPPDTYIKGA